MAENTARETPDDPTVLPARVTGDLRLVLLGRLARRINEAPEITELARDSYQLLRQVLPVDALHLVQFRPAPSDQQGTLLEDVAESAGEWRQGEEAHLKSHVSCPLWANGRLVGRLAIGSREEDAYSGADARFFQTVADHLAGALATDLDRALVQRREEEVRELERERLQIARVLSTISASIDQDSDPAQGYALVLQQAALIIPYQDASISLYLDGTHRTAAAVGPALEWLPADVTSHPLWRTRTCLDMPQCRTEPSLAGFAAAAGLRDVLSLPLVLNGSVIGRLTFASRIAQCFGSRHLHYAQLLAERTAQVIRIAQVQAAQEAALAKMSQLDLLRTEFVATVSHELRTPLTGILGYLELLLSRWSSLNDDRRVSMLQRAQSSAARLEHLVTDLLLFSNVEHQELQLHPASCPLLALVDQATEDMGTKYRGQRIIVRPSPQRALVRVDVQRTIQVIANLLDNAVKYSAEGSPVGIRWVLRAEEVEVIVGDRGPGIKREDQPRLFTRFGTLGHQPRPGQVGTGIGLYVCKRLLEAMGGRIWVVSREGRGSFFHFTLPRAEEPGALAAADA